MGILRTREEYLPVTCAILKPGDREAFFSAIKKQSHGKPDQIAKLCEVETDMVNDWVAGKSNVPYHFLQMLAHHYNVPLPPVGELRREYLAVSQTAARRDSVPAAAKAKAQPQKEERQGRRERKPKAEKPGRGERPRRERAPRGASKPKAERPQPPQQARPQQQQAQPQQPPQAHPQQQQPHPQPPQKKAPKGKAEPKGPRVPEPSESLAYWIGVTIMTAQRQQTELVMTADRRIGQNFAGTWANLTRELLGVRPSLKMVDNGKAQEARLPCEGFEEFFDRLDLKPDRKPGEAGVPRWAWSNPAWKVACVKGVVDACAHFQRAPALTLHALPERLAKALQKMLHAMGFTAEAAADGTVTLHGVELLDRYFDKVGTSNMKLRDQYKAYKNPHTGGRRMAEEAEKEAVEAVGLGPGTDEDTEKDEVRVVGEEIETADEEEKHEHEEEALEATGGLEASPEESIEAALDAAAAAKAAASAQPSRFGEPPPQPKPKPTLHRRKTVWRGRPKY